MKAHVRIVQKVTVFPGFADDLNGVKQSYSLLSEIFVENRFFLILAFFILYDGERGMSRSFLFYFVLFYILFILLILWLTDSYIS